MAKVQLRDPRTGRLVWVQADAIESTVSSPANDAAERTAPTRRGSPSSPAPKAAPSTKAPKVKDDLDEFLDDDAIEDAEDE